LSVIFSSASATLHNSVSDISLLLFQTASDNVFVGGQLLLVVMNYVLNDCVSLQVKLRNFFLEFFVGFSGHWPGIHGPGPLFVFILNQTEGSRMSKKVCQFALKMLHSFGIDIDIVFNSNLLLGNALLCTIRLTPALSP
jgi:hypothetical protein